ncbi:hypothetical protein HPB48_020621 [Haemaphysalis longicornis]|uniref:Uncharacterized protein n=1 Tax=Haemaphysalis longicornis TaxID=44386 RepID=A0A9J6GTS1_HAELO|nr:hypothetical protein HPB48_020621 [Haemaphysalis longicornis]
MDSTIPRDSTNQNVASHDMEASTNPHPWQFATTAPRQATSTTVVLKFLDNTNLSALNFAHLCHAILQTSGLIERNDTFVKLRDSQNFLAIDTYRHTAVQNINSMQEGHINGKCRGVRSYVTNDASNAREVIHGSFTDVAYETLRAELHISGRKILAARRVGMTNTILITVEVRSLPPHATFFSGVYPIFPQQPQSKQRHPCHAIGHCGSVCPNKNEYVRCANCGKQFSPNVYPATTPHECEAHCVNCNGKHKSSSANCQARIDATKALRSRFCDTQRRHREPRPQRNDACAWPPLPTSTRFDFLPLSHERSKSRHRSKHSSLSLHRRPGTSSKLYPQTKRHRQNMVRIEASQQALSIVHATSPLQPHQDPLQTNQDPPQVSSPTNPPTPSPVIKPMILKLPTLNPICTNTIQNFPTPSPPQQ